jgi:hypothetical protein
MGAVRAGCLAQLLFALAVVRKRCTDRAPDATLISQQHRTAFPITALYLARNLRRPSRERMRSGNRLVHGLQPRTACATDRETKSPAPVPLPLHSHAFHGRGRGAKSIALPFLPKQTKKDEVGRPRPLRQLRSKSFLPHAFARFSIVETGGLIDSTAYTRNNSGQKREAPKGAECEKLVAAVSIQSPESSRSFRRLSDSPRETGRQMLVRRLADLA